MNDLTNEQNKMIKILANDGIDPIGKKMLEDAGFEVDTNNIPQDELPEKLKNYDAITVRSATKVRKALIDATPNLKLIGRGGVGVDNIDVEYAKEKGIVGLKGHRSVGGFRASIYNALPITSVYVLIDAMREFAEKNK